MGRKISDICLKQGQGMRGRAAPPHPGIYRVPPPPPPGSAARLSRVMLSCVKLVYKCERIGFYRKLPLRCDSRKDDLAAHV